jgi:deferrochelatase/peroxidase EfeB
MSDIYTVRFSMTPFIWHTDASLFVFKDGKVNVDQETRALAAQTAGIPPR